MTKITRNASSNSSSPDMLSETIKGLAEGLTGIAASDKSVRYLSIGHLLQKFRSGRFLNELKAEWDKFREKGRIKGDYATTEQHYECLQEILDFLDTDSPDRIRFAALKEIFLTTATEMISDRESLLPQQYM